MKKISKAISVPSPETIGRQAALAHRGALVIR